MAAIGSKLGATFARFQLSDCDISCGGLSIPKWQEGDYLLSN